jgi:hypothetical protein
MLVGCLADVRERDLSSSRAAPDRTASDVLRLPLGAPARSGSAVVREPLLCGLPRPMAAGSGREHPSLA